MDFIVDSQGVQAMPIVEFFKTIALVHPFSFSAVLVAVGALVYINYFEKPTPMPRAEVAEVVPSKPWASPALVPGRPVRYAPDKPSALLLGIIGPSRKPQGLLAERHGHRRQFRRPLQALTS